MLSQLDSSAALARLTCMSRQVFQYAAALLPHHAPALPANQQIHSADELHQGQDQRQQLQIMAGEFCRKHWGGRIDTASPDNDKAYSS